MVRKGSLEFSNDVFVVAGGLTETLVPLVGTTLHVHSGTMDLQLCEPTNEERSEVSEQREERERREGRGWRGKERRGGQEEERE